jgi:hypothetical protein
MKETRSLFSVFDWSADFSPRVPEVANDTIPYSTQLDRLPGVCQLHEWTAPDFVPSHGKGWRDLPTCPSDGVYTLGSVTNHSSCSIPGHVLPQ